MNPKMGMKELQADEAKEKMLRLGIEASDYSGFQYNFALKEKSNNDDRIFERYGVKLVVDTISLSCVKGATVDYVEERLISAFKSAFFLHMKLEFYQRGS